MSNKYDGKDAIQVSTGGAHICVLTKSGNVYCWGYNEFGQANPKISETLIYSPSLAYDGKDAIAIVCGYTHTCALLKNQTVYCWGSNKYGESQGYP